MNTKRTCLFLLMILAIPAFPQTIHFRDDGSKIQFVIKNFGLNVNGTLKGLTGKFMTEKDNPEKSEFEATVRAETIDTGIGLRDKHLRQEDYLNVTKYPVIRISSTSVSKLGNQWICQALLTIKDITKSVSIPFVMQMTESGVILRSDFTINRLDFDVGSKSFSMDNVVHIKLIIAGTMSQTIDQKN